MVEDSVDILDADRPENRLHICHAVFLVAVGLIQMSAVCSPVIMGTISLLSVRAHATHPGPTRWRRVRP
jgi:hypothetical protein